VRRGRTREGGGPGVQGAQTAGRATSGLAPAREAWSRHLMTDAASRLAEFLALVAGGCSQREAVRIAGVSRETLWRKRRSSPEFAAALHAAEARSRETRAEERERRFRAQFLALAIDHSDKGELQTVGRMSRREKKLWYRWRGEWPDSAIPSGDDRLAQMIRNDVRARQQASFAQRRAAKAKGNPALPDQREHEPKRRPGPASSGSPRKTGRAGVLW
jgi:hypothetical protein